MAEISARTNRTNPWKRYCQTRNEKQLEGLQLALRAVWQFTHIRPGTHSFLGVEKERPAIAKPRQGFEHGALSLKSQTFAPAPIAPASARMLLTF